MDVYVVSYSFRPESGYRSTGRDRVIAAGIEDAIGSVRAERPTAHIWSCGHHGRVDLVTQAAAEELAEMQRKAEEDEEQ